MACNCGCGGGCKGTSTLSDRRHTHGYYLSDPSSDDIRRIAEEEAKKELTVPSIAQIASGDFTPVVNIAERTARRVCSEAATEEIISYWPVGVGAVLLVFFAGYAAGQ